MMSLRSELMHCSQDLVPDNFYFAKITIANLRILPIILQSISYINMTATIKVVEILFLVF